MDAYIECVGVEGLVKCPEATRAWVFHNIDATTAKIVGSAIKKMPHLKQLWITGNDMGIEGLGHILDALREYNIIEELDLGHNQFGDDGAVLIGAWMSESKSIKKLHLYNNLISDHGARHIAEGLGANKSITYLCISENFIEDEGAAHICARVRDSKQLRYLDISYNGIGNEGARHVGRMLVKNKSLRTMHLMGPRITVHGKNSILHGLRINNTLLHLVMSGGAPAIRKMLDRNRALHIRALQNFDMFQVMTVSGMAPILPKHLMGLIKKYLE
jgi:Ran GTPase-activating protein (RanGAP) involved in mRNA processing and transport